LCWPDVTLRWALADHHGNYVRKGVNALEAQVKRVEAFIVRRLTNNLYAD